MTGKAHFRLFMIRCVLAATAIDSCFILLLEALGIFTLPLYHVALLLFQSVLCVVLYYSVSKRRERIDLVVWLYIITILISQLSTDLLPINDVMRFTWSFAYVAASVAVGGLRIGLAVLAISIASIVYANTTLHVLPVNSLISLCGSLGVTFLAMAIAVQYVYQTLDALQQARDEQARLARTDVVTGLANRLAFENRLKQFVAANDEFWLVLADLDNFKQVNDTFGHEAGDVVLRQTAALFAEAVDKNGLAARIGGEEFGLLFAKPDGDHAFGRVEATRKRIEDEHIKYRGKVIHITASFGVVRSHAPHSASSRLYSRADRALYEAKNGGRNRCCLAHDETDSGHAIAAG